MILLKKELSSITNRCSAAVVVNCRGSDQLRAAGHGAAGIEGADRRFVAALSCGGGLLPVCRRFHGHFPRYLDPFDATTRAAGDSLNPSLAVAFRWRVAAREHAAVGAKHHARRTDYLFICLAQVFSTAAPALT